MTLADTSVWIQHFRTGLPELAHLLREGQVLIHPIIIGELATGNLHQRKATLALLQNLPSAKAETDAECLAFLETHQLFGRGIGWNDLQLLVASRLSGARLWTLDQRLASTARTFGHH